MWRFRLPSHLLSIATVVGLTLTLIGPASITARSIEQPRDRGTLQPIAPAAPQPTHVIHLKSRDFTPGATDRAALQALVRSDQGRLHLLVQLDFIPRDLAKAELEKNGVKLLAYVPDYAWIASAPASDPAAALSLPGVTWVGPFTIDDKLDPMIRANEWSKWNLAPDGTAAVYVVTHLDEEVAVTRQAIERLGGKITGEVQGIKMLMAEMPRERIRALAAEEAVQWIEPAAPPLGEANDGIRQQIGVDILQSAPYNLTGTGVDVLVYDSGQVGNHVDFSGRLVHGDTDIISEHSTHVAGTVGGSGANSVAHGGTALQWRGMAPAVDLISYGTGWTSGIMFYEDVGDIEHDWAEAQNTYGADLGTASIGSNVYKNYPTRCDIMGNYGAADVVIDQMIRGGNSQVGLGDRYIATWANGNERNNTGSCSNTYSSIAPPAAAKNPIHVGASNTNDNSMTSFSSWGPTDDGRIKPIVVAGGCQSSGDFGVTSAITVGTTSTYDSYCGTSMATPAVAGSIALMLQHYRSVYSTSGNFWPSTAKAILMQTADDFGNPGPDYQWGFGQVDIHAAVDLISRRAFLQDSVAAGGTDVFFFPVMTNAAPAQVSLAWDDYEATLNANPALINNLDLELVAPSGTIWRPWILDPANPANNATRGVNNRDNEEQVTVPSPEIGTWIVRVKGTTVPQGPQDYSLACEGCKALNLGVCQSTVSSVLLLPASPLTPQGPALDDEEDVNAAPHLEEAPLTAGEQWQRWLESGVPQSAPSVSPGEETRPHEQLPPAATDQPLDEIQQPPSATRAMLEQVEQARAQGLPALMALADRLTGEARDLALDEIRREQKPLALFTAPQANPVRAPAVSRVGINGACAYPTIQQAVNAANNGDTIRVSAGVYFENVNITTTKTITVEGDYNATCTATGGGSTRIDGSANSDNTVYLSGGVTRLRNLAITWGSGTFGAGIEALGPAQVILDNADVFNNYGVFGGGVYVGTGAVVTATNGSEIHDNAATSDGGGVKVWEQFFGYSTTSDTYNNCAPNGGGFSVPGGQLYLNAADMSGNQAAGATGKGGGIYVTSGGVVTLTNSAFVYFLNRAYDGAGIYADNAKVYLQGAGTTLRDNIATNYGGGIYLTNNSRLTSIGAHIGQAGAGLANEAARGAGIYAITSTIDFAGSIINNIASGAGAGIYATASTVNLTNATVGGIGVNEANQLSATGHEGVGLYLTNNTQATLSNTIVASNTFQTSGWTYGGGLHVSNGSAVTLTNSRVERHIAQSNLTGRGGGIYIDSARVTLDNTDVISNTSGGAGGGIRLWSASALNVLNNSSLVNNQALTGEGGAIAAAINVGTPDINITNATLQYNTAATDGGAIYLDAGRLDVNGWWDVQSNHAAGNGGAIAIVGTGNAGFYVTGGAQQTYLATNHADGNGGALYVTNNAHVDLYATGAYPLNLKTNHADGHGGAAYANNGAMFDFYGLVNANGNQAVGNGGVFYLSGGSRAWLDDYLTTRPQIWSNQAQNGGVVYAQANSLITCDGSDVGTGAGGNSATAGSGGAFYLSGSTLTDNNCVFRNNQATLNGGAIAGYTSTLTIDTDYPTLVSVARAVDRLSPTAPQATACDPLAGQCSSFRDNKADSDANNSGDGGAIYANGGPLTVNYTYLHRNSAYRGGAIYQAGAGAVGQVNNTLIYSNTSTANQGAGIRSEAGSFTMTHVTLANNINGAGYLQSGTTGRANNSIATGNANGGFATSGGTLTGACNIDQSGNIGTNVNPLFVAPGAGENYHLQLGSPAIDACPTGLPRDLENVVRPFGTHYDMGAYESHYRFVYLPLVLKNF